jgi:riboflavin synthase
MFTGLIETIGRVVSADRTAGGVRLRVDLGPAADGVRPGDSIDLSGACQTVACIDSRLAEFDTVAETLARTTLGAWGTGTPVNVERSLRPGDRLGGHFVAGHVDATGLVIENREGGGGWILRVEAPEALAPEIAPKGSIAVDGVSLTVVEAGPPAFTVALVPTTLRETTLGRLTPGDRVNLETDLLAKYVRRAMAAGGAAGAADADRRLMAALERAGFLEPGA